METRDDFSFCNGRTSLFTRSNDCAFLGFVFTFLFRRTTLAQELVVTRSPTLVYVGLVDATVLDKLGFLEHTSGLADALGEFGETARHTGFIEAERLSVFNTMKVTYMATVDPDVRYSEDIFQKELAVYLSDPDGWVSQGYVFVEVKRNPRVHIRLSSPKTLQESGCRNGGLSCADLGGSRIWLNAMRWGQGASKSQLPLSEYRQYMVTHEMGHILGHDHAKCPGTGHPAPLMMQQTLGIGACKPNTKLTQSDLSSK